MQLAHDPIRLRPKGMQMPDDLFKSRRNMIKLRPNGMRSENDRIPVQY